MWRLRWLFVEKFTLIASVYPHTASKYLEKTWTHLTLKPLKYQNEKYEYRAVEEINWLSVEDDPALMRVKAVITVEISSAQIYHSPHTQLQSLTVHNHDSVLDQDGADAPLDGGYEVKWADLQHSSLHYDANEVIQS